MRSLAVIVAICVGGCGIALTQKPDPHQPASERPRCTESYRAPKQDAIGAAVGLVLILWGATSLDTAGNEALATPLLIGGVGLFAASVMSGAVGRSRVKKCRAAIAEHDARVKAQPPPPPPEPPAPPPPEQPSDPQPIELPPTSP
jgi:hypothetical protein